MQVSWTLTKIFHPYYVKVENSDIFLTKQRDRLILAESLESCAQDFA